MSFETRKLRIIEGFLKTNDKTLLDKAEALLNDKSKPSEMPAEGFFGIWSEKEADEMKEIISEGCERIDHEDW
ncbi:MAG: hypothetical protein RIC35_00430 [Marinoscillum sp.]